MGGRDQAELGKACIGALELRHNMLDDSLSESEEMIRLARAALDKVEEIVQASLVQHQVASTSEAPPPNSLKGFDTLPRKARDELEGVQRMINDIIARVRSDKMRSAQLRSTLSSMKAAVESVNATDSSASIFFRAANGAGSTDSAVASSSKMVLPSPDLSSDSSLTTNLESSDTLASESPPEVLELSRLPGVANFFQVD
ncbi:hypothetical protein K437DRAFT_257936 [Tilletiaria anomala UBC 951]|uniref:Uncharacterized protein n=1 Tax=Tilletiaria anomala (strain ATCC 24038 / CBS 436.72 / UBC 951) TaxID=1037660 RepID=A0A066VLF3_TILAU|nr:uncharacterized protein K437DRAFT_257936 [Tilletiaria anomala UBC 951]KDN42301.1 hypothetical protein K437DRAFT_257936 [Tilletiaria anomala UBC 951]